MQRHLHRKSVFNNLPIYHLSLFPIPSTIADKIEKQNSNTGSWKDIVSNIHNQKVALNLSFKKVNARESTWCRIVSGCAKDVRLWNIANEEICALVGNGCDTSFISNDRAWQLLSSILYSFQDYIYYLSEDKTSSIVNMGVWDR